MDSYTDEQILDYVKYANPEQYDAVVQKEDKPEFEGGFWSAASASAGETWNYATISEKYFLPAMHIQMMHDWKTGDEEVDKDRWLEVMSRSEYGENISNEQLLKLKSDIENSVEVSKFNDFANEIKWLKSFS